MFRSLTQSVFNGSFRSHGPLNRRHFTSEGMPTNKKGFLGFKIPRWLAWTIAIAGTIESAFWLKVYLMKQGSDERKRLENEGAMQGTTGAGDPK
ncbi:hypothetical protein BT69DRAFT_1276413 [Atractiella rhizophila]|nr:hypothetical protein BT69DRAFT_1276413 [Atractiella rhizophila]